MIRTIDYCENQFSEPITNGQKVFYLHIGHVFYPKTRVVHHNKIKGSVVYIILFSVFFL